MASEPYSERPSAELLAGLRAGDDAAAAEVYARYAERLLALARSRLSARLARRFDPDDVLQSAYRSFFVRAERGDFQVAASGDLWRLLAAIVIRKLRKQVKRHRAALRSVEREETAGPAGELAAETPEPTAADVLVAAEELSWLLAQLAPQQRAAVEQRLGGAELQPIAERLGVNERTVRRWLAMAENLLIERGAQLDARPAPRPHIAPAAPPPEFPLDPRDYVLRRLIGSGGVCKVYEAAERASGRSVTVKVLRRELLARPRLIERFVQEAALVARCAHPRIVPIRGLGRLPSGGYFMVMEFIDGRTLGELLRAGPLKPSRACDLASRVAQIVQHAHERGVLHGDLKPENVLLDGSGEVWLTDFGFGSLLETGAAAPERTAAAGTPGFMAPEQLDPDAGPLSVRTDVFGLGALLYVLLTGQTYERGEAFSAAFSPELQGVLHRALAAESSERFGSARELAAALACCE
jgi:RNA polymerase sigma factor (sigma-70 family)